MFVQLHGLAVDGPFGPLVASGLNQCSDMF